jgi:hypothetical protein
MSDDYESGYCEVCEGRRSIRLPLRRMLSVAAFDPAAYIPEAVVQASFKDYPCPECVQRVPYSKLQSIKCMTFVDEEQIRTPDAKKWWRENAEKILSRQITDGLLSKGLLKIRDLEPTPYHSRAVCATVCVVAPNDTIELEERIAERQMDVADEFAKEAKRLIDNWGSFYGQTDILKCDARREIDAAIRNVRDRREKLT